MLIVEIMEEKMKEEKPLNDLQAEQQKRAYTKPLLSQIQLVAEEAVLALCKYGDGSPSAKAKCKPDMTCVSIRRS